MSKTVRKTLNDDIHQMATKRLAGPITKENHEQYCDIWIECAREIKSNFETEGLTETVKAVQEIIDVNLKLKPIEEPKQQNFQDFLKTTKLPPKPKTLDEDILPDDYPMYAGYVYLVDNKVIENDFECVTVFVYKQKTGCKEVRRCDIYGRLALTENKAN